MEEEKKEKREKRERGERNSNFSLRSMEIGGSVFVGPRTKDHLPDKGYTWVPKTRDFAEDSSEQFGKSRVSDLVVSTRLPRETSMLQEVGLLLLWLFSTLRVVWLCLAPRGMFGCILNYGKLPYFDPMH